jgi:CheY-like chemotaxis protein
VPEDETSVVLSINVADTGIGIAREHWESIFESFRQVGEGLDRRHGGTGLGLSITRRLTGILGGKVELESEPDRGTEFRFTFPKVAISAELPVEEKRFSADEDFNLLRPSLILAADDVSLNRELVAGYLEGTHHRLIQASTGREAFERARQFHPDLVLMDVRMPDMGGEEALEEIRAEESLALVPVIAVTASSLLGEEHQLRTIFDGYIRKPFSRTTLFQEIARFIGGYDGATEKHDLPVGAVPMIETTPANAAAWSAMVERLREIQTESWKLLTESLGIRETKAFALQLVELAEEADCRPLHSYAQQMLTAADQFDIGSLEESVAAFPILVNRLEAVTHTGP